MICLSESNNDFQRFVIRRYIFCVEAGFIVLRVPLVRDNGNELYLTGLGNCPLLFGTKEAYVLQKAEESR